MVVAVCGVASGGGGRGVTVSRRGTSRCGHGATGSDGISGRGGRGGIGCGGVASGHGGRGGVTASGRGSRHGHGATGHDGITGAPDGIVVTATPIDTATSLNDALLTDDPLDGNQPDEADEDADDEDKDDGDVNTGEVMDMTDMSRQSVRIALGGDGDNGYEFFNHFDTTQVTCRPITAPFKEIGQFCKSFIFLMQYILICHSNVYHPSVSLS